MKRNGIPGAVVVGGVHIGSDLLMLVVSSASLYYINTYMGPFCDLVRRTSANADAATNPTDELTCDDIAMGGNLVSGFVLAIFAVDFLLALLVVIGTLVRNRCLLLPYILIESLISVGILIAVTVFASQHLSGAATAGVFVVMLLIFGGLLFLVVVVIVQFVAIGSPQKDVDPEDEEEE